MSSLRNDLIEEAIRYIDANPDKAYKPELMVDFFLDKWHKLEPMLEALGGWCQSCPVEVQREFHDLPYTKSQHFDHPFEEPEVRMARLREKPND